MNFCYRSWFYGAIRVQKRACVQQRELPFPGARRTSLVASAQQGRETVYAILPSACQWFARFGTIGRNFSKELRRFRWQAQKA
jgi:hypothetical protein